MVIASAILVACGGTDASGPASGTDQPGASDSGRLGAASASGDASQLDGAAAPAVDDADATTSEAGAEDAATGPRDAGRLDFGAGDARGPTADGAPSAGTLSGLPWRSGAATDEIGAFATWRARALDVGVNWDNRSTWAEIEDADIYGAIAAFKSFPGVLALGTAMVPGDGKTLASGVTFADCAAGQYDSHFAKLGTNLVAERRGDSFIRLGWEANGDWYAWSAGNAANAQEWVQCFRREVTALRSTAPNVKIDWNMNADTKTPASGNPTDIYPGDTYVDVVGVDFYDNWPALDTEALWASHYMDQASGGGPHGIGAWLAFAKSHGKPLSIPEWGIVHSTGNNCGCGGDDPIYVTHMHDFFAANALNIAYETYFNLGDSSGDTTFLVYPATTSPNASSAYKSLF